MLINLIRGLPDRSLFKTHAGEPFGRGGDWTILERMIAALHKEVAAYRAAQYAGGPHEYQYEVFLSPREAENQLREIDEQFEFHDQEFGKLLAAFND